MNENIEKLLKNIDVPDERIAELCKKAPIIENIRKVQKTSSNFTKLHYTLACTAPKNIDLTKVCPFIDNQSIKHESMLRGVIKHLGSSSEESVEAFIDRNSFSREEIANYVNSKQPLSKNEMLKEVKKEMPYADSKVVLELVSEVCMDGVSTRPVNKADERFKWFEEGEILQVPKPKNNKQANEKILNEHLERTGGRVVTRFPPEPNGQLHIGHAKAINISFLYAEKHGGMTYLRFDDTNPKNEKEEHYNAIVEDVKWLGFTPYEITASSDYNDRMLDMSVKLIKKDKAYVCHCSLEDIRNRRQIYQRERDEGRSDPTILSPYRNRPIAESLEEFNKMLAGGYKEGEAILRFKMDLESKNQHMLDLVGARCIDIVHPKKNRNWHVYPTYEFALCVCDSLEDVTHSFCSREFMTRQESYHWLLRNLELYEPIQWEFSRLNLSNTVLSKRKMLSLVNNHGFEWDDPRFYTIAGMRRRGFPPEAINKFVRSLGITYSESIVDVRILENFVRTELNATSKKVFCIKAPIKVTINNLTKRQIDIANLNKETSSDPCLVEVNKILYIDESDFSESPAEDFHRLTPTQPVGLIGIGAIKFVEKGKDGIVCELCDAKPLKFVQWVSSLNDKVTLRLYKPLFNSFNPEEIGFQNDVNLDSLEVVDGYCDSRITNAKASERFQFVRMGFFCCDKTTTDGELVFNMTLPLKNLY
ncbi:glutaminyl-tRNA synthetase [Pancytospora epiphaga]|nr:glutaminyl-tRNA synthetase [Pancytospora epiphaga]